MLPLAAALAFLLGTQTLAPQAVSPRPVSPDDTLLGAAIFRTHCAVCHGERGTGDGPLTGQLRFAPPDLTRVTRRGRKAEFPLELVTRIVDGREPMKGHGGTDMPIWGDAFLESREGYSREQAKERIRLVVRFLESIQKD